MSFTLRKHQREVMNLCADILNGNPIKEAVQ
jgi:hypothetical protein